MLCSKIKTCLCGQVTTPVDCEDPLQYQMLAEEREVLNKHYLMTWSMEPNILTTAYGSRWLSTPVTWGSQRSYWITKLARGPCSPTRSLDSCPNTDSASLESVGSDDVPAKTSSEDPTAATPRSVPLHQWHSSDASDLFPRPKVSKYKTELCTKWDELGECRFGSRCIFAHGEHELRQRVRPAWYKTKPCKRFHGPGDGVCSYGRRCMYVH